MTTITIPETPDQVVELLNDAKQLGELIKAGLFGDAMKAYADKAMNADNGELMKLCREEMQVALADWLQENRVQNVTPAAVAAAVEQKLAGNATSSARRALFSRYAPGVAADGIFEDRTELFRAIALAAGKSKPSQALQAKLGKLTEIRNSYSSEVPDAGGALIPEQYRSEILALAIEKSIVRQRATVIPMASLRVVLPSLDDRSHVSNIFGGVQWYWTEEAGTLVESQASFGRTVLDAKKLTAFAGVPNELLQDAPAFGAFFDMSFPAALAFGEDVAFFTGTGTGEPQGFINCAASVNVAAESGQPTKTIVWENITKMYARMLPTSLASAVWIANIETFPQLATMALSVGTGGGPVWIGNFSGGNGGMDTPPVTILGRPVIFTEKAQALGTAGDINFVDLPYYLIGDRMALEVSASEHFYFQNDKMAYRAVQRVDGRPWLQAPLTPHNGSSTLTAFVQLASR